MDLSKLGLTGEQLATVAEYMKASEGKVKEYEAQLKELSDIKANWETEQAKYETAQNDIQELLKQSTEKQAALEKQNQELQLTSSTTEFLSGLEKQFVNKETKSYFANEINKMVSEGKTHDEAFKTLAGDREDIWSTPKQSVSKPLNPQTQGTQLTKESIKNMTAQEINANWETVSQLLTQ
jgi:hypothetical protein